MNVIPKAAIWKGYDREKRRYLDLHYNLDPDNDLGFGYGAMFFRESIRGPWRHIRLPGHPRSKAKT